MDEDLRAFIAAHFPSIEQLEILLLLRTLPSHAWTVETVFQKIQSSLASVSERLLELSQRGFIDAHEAHTFRYAPKTPELSAMTERVAEAYKSRRVAVVEAIYGPSSSAAAELARAFKLRAPKS